MFLFVIQWPLIVYLIAWIFMTGLIVYFAWFAGCERKKYFQERKKRFQAEAKLSQLQMQSEEELVEINHGYATMALMLEDHTQQIADLRKQMEESASQVPVNMMLLPASCVPWIAEEDEDPDPEWIQHIQQELEDL